MEQLEDRSLLAVCDTGTVVLNTNDSGSGSLREAINCANSRPGTDLISFNIPGTGVHTISVQTQLPTLTESAIIDGYTQPGAKANSNAIDDPDPSKRGFNGTLLIELKNGGSVLEGLVLADGSTVRGLVINSFGHNGINIGANCIIEGNFVGTDPGGTLRRGNSGVGVEVDGSNNRIGGTAPASRNVISDNLYWGIRLERSGLSATSGNVIQGNFVGTDASGTKRLGNGQTGIELQGATNNLIGGTVPGARNVASANGSIVNANGIDLFYSSNSNTVQGNYVGVDVTGTKGLGNTQVGIGIYTSNSNQIGGTSSASANIVSANQTGISLSSASSNVMQGNFVGTDITGTLALGNSLNGISLFTSVAANQVGGTSLGASNTIAFNLGSGVHLPDGSGTKNGILGNSIYSNHGLGIDLGGDNQGTGDGVTANDVGDADSGPNNLQNFPVISAVGLSSGNLTIHYVVPSTTANSAYPLRVEYFKADSDGQEGRTFIGFDTYLATEASTTKTVVLTPLATVSTGDKIVATATDNNGNTSEFSVSQTVPLPDSPPVITSNNGGDTASISVPENTTTVTNVDATDSDAGQTLAYGIVGGLDSGKFSIDSSSGVLRFATAPNYEKPTDSDTNNLYQVIVGVSDGTASDTQTLSVTVTDQNDPPVITSNGGTDYASVSVPENTTFVTQVQALDEDAGATLTYSIPGGNSLFSIDSKTGILSFVSPPDFENPIDDQHLNIYNVLVDVSDGQSIDLQQINIMVTNVSEPCAGTIVTNTNDSGPGSFRAALNCANDRPGLDTITFNIPGSGVHTIAPTVVLPAITDPVIIDGYSQLGASPNSNGPDLPNNAVLRIEISGGFGSAIVPGLRITGGGSTIRGLVINDWGAGNARGDAIVLETGGGNHIEGNFIGTDPTGSVFAGNGNRGIYVLQSSNNVIGGTTIGSGNLISGNTYGIDVEDGSSDNVIAGNFIGTDSTGTKPITNRNFGALISGTNNLVGGTLPAARNVISGNGIGASGTGVGIGGQGNRVEGNYIGTDPTGTFAVTSVDGQQYTGITAANGVITGNVISGNLGYGLGLDYGNDVENNLIGTTASGSSNLGNGRGGIVIDLGGPGPSIGNNLVAQNTIAFNHGPGIAVPVTGFSPLTQNAFSTNSMFSNAGLGIDLGGTGKTPNDVHDADTGPNNLQNSPVVSTAEIISGRLRLTYTVSSATANSAYPLTIEFYKAASDGQEGQIFLGNDTYLGTEAETMKTFIIAPLAPVSSGDKIVATATDNLGNTSEFSASQSAIPPNSPPNIISNNGGDTASINVAENMTAVTDVDATDPDSGQMLTYSIAGGADSGKFAIDPSSGVLTFASAPDFEKPGDSDTNNVYQVVVGVSDGVASDTQTLSVTVTNVNEAPVFTNDGGGATASVNVAEGTTAVTTVKATDPEGSAVTLAKIGGSDSLRFSFTASTGVMAFFVAPDFEKPNDSDKNNSYVAVIRASDGTLTSTQTITVNVTNVNEAPSFTSDGGGAIAKLGRFENSQLVTTLTGSDPDANSMLTFSIVGGVDSDKFSLDTTTRDLSFVTAPDFEQPTDFDHNNVYEVTVQVSDGSLSVTQDIAVTIFDVFENSPPTAHDDSNAIDEDSLLSIAAPGILQNDTDPDANDSRQVVAVNNLPSNVGKTLTFASGAQMIVQADGSYQFDPRGKYDYLGSGKSASESFQYTMDDSQGAISSATVTIRIDGVNDAPVAGNDQFATDEDTLLSVSAAQLLGNDSDAEGDTLMIAPKSQPLHGQLQFRMDGSFTYLPAKDFNGSDAFTYQLSDGQTLSNVATVSLTVNAINDRPVVSLGGNLMANEGTAFSAQGSFSDPDSNDPGSSDSWTASVDYGDGTVLPLALNANKSFSLSHAYADNGKYTVTVGVKDSGRLTGTASFQVQVINVAPQQLSWSGPTQALPGQAVTFTGGFTDPGVLDTETASVDWGDHTTSDATVTGGSGVWQVSASHTYSAFGTFSVVVTVRDKDGDTATKSANVGALGGVLNAGMLSIVGSDMRDAATVKLSTDSKSLLLAGTTGGVAFSQSFSVAAVQRIMANLGAGDDSLVVDSKVKLPLLVVAGDGNDTVQSGGGPSVLIGGAGQDTLTGGAKSDLLIAGTTSYDANSTALAAILSEWSSSRLMNTRISNLRTGAGSVLKGTGISLVSGKTVFNDASVDSLIGNGDFNWFLSDAKKDKVKYVRGDVIH